MSETIVCSSTTQAELNKPTTRIDTAVSALSYLSILGGLGSFAAAIHITVLSYFPIPYWDMWWTYNYLVHPDSPLLTWLWTQHNEHRILIPKLFLMADFWLFQGREIFLLASILAVLLIHAALLLWAFRTLAGMRGAIWRTAVGLTGLCVFSTTQWENFASGFQIAFVLVELFVTLSLVSVLVYLRTPRDKRQQRYLWIAILAAAAATCSLSNGIVVWLLLLLIALLEGASKWVAALIAALGATMIAAYLYHYSNVARHSNPLASLHQPLQLADYVVHYFGGICTWLGSTRVVFFGHLCLAGAAIIVCISLVRRARDPLSLLLSGLVLFYVGTAVITGLGRLKFGNVQAQASRYEAFSLLVWLSIAMQLIRLAARYSRIFLIVVQSLVLFLMATSFLHIKVPIVGARGRALRLNTAAMAIVTGALDPVLLGWASPEMSSVLLNQPILKRLHKSVFATSIAKDLNQPLLAIERLRPEKCLGVLHPVDLIKTTTPPSLRVTGWAWDPVRREPPNKIVFAMEDRIVGYAQPGFPTPGLDKRLFARSAANAGWIGFVEPLERHSPIDLYGVVGRGEICRVADLAIPVPKK